MQLYQGSDAQNKNQSKIGSNTLLNEFYLHLQEDKEEDEEEHPMVY